MNKSVFIVHCSDTPNGRPTTAREIDRWHAARVGDMAARDEDALIKYVPQYPYCGYHGVIYLDGHLERTRAETEVGSHCVGHNHDGLGFCLIGTDRFTLEQWNTLRSLYEDCCNRWGPLELHGHRDFSDKTCPGFDVQLWKSYGFNPLPANLYPSNPPPPLVLP